MLTLYELFQTDAEVPIQEVVFNGWVEPSPFEESEEELSCILTVRAKRDSFLNLDLGAMTPADCIEELGGVKSGPLAERLPVEPIQVYSSATA